MDQFCFTKPYMSIIKSTQDQNETPQKTTSFQKVKRSALPKYQPTYKSIYDDYVKLGLLSFPKGLVFPSPSKKNCVSTDTWKWECCKQSNATVALCLEKDTPAITYTTRGTKPCLYLSISWSLLPIWCLTMRYHTSKLCFMELAWIHAQPEVCSAHVNLYCLGHVYSVALLFVGILFHILPNNHDTTSTSREQRDRRTVRLQLYLPSNQQHMLLHCTARTQRQSSSSATA